jgi:hypothetical protein
MAPNFNIFPMFFDIDEPSPPKLAYWKLIPYASLRRPEGTPLSLKIRLRALGVCYKPTATAKRCEKLLQRFERGLITYGTCSASELATFAQQRRLPCKSMPSQHARLRSLLERADDEQKFEKFLVSLNDHPLIV